MPPSREKAQKALEHLHTLDFIGSEMPLKKFIETGFNDLQRLVMAGNTKREIYSFLISEYELDLGTYATFIRAWERYANQHVKQPHEVQREAHGCNTVQVIPDTRNNAEELDVADKERSTKEPEVEIEKPASQESIIQEELKGRDSEKPFKPVSEMTQAERDEWETRREGEDYFEWRKRIHPPRKSCSPEPVELKSGEIYIDENGVRRFKY